ncbi:MAG: carbamoyl-phosphate synthase large subunit, partial [Proteobacteria bacterium]|nr:carbamoyl-phosphate synthase large subunit [Pseudomonadota bacterium]
THIKPWFIGQMKELVELEEEILAFKGRDLPDDLLVRAKMDGFADRHLAKLLGVAEARIREQRTKLGCVEAWDALPVSGVENAAYYYSTYNRPDRVPSSSRKKIMVLGGGPNRIGQGIEFDYCCVHAAFALREAGYETIMVNCNPETVSTDYDTSDKLYFEPLTVEDVLAIYEKEKPEGVVVQFGGQTPLNIAGELAAAGVKILGTSPDTIDLAEDRDRFRQMMEKMGIAMPESGMAASFEEARQIAARIGYPVMVRPSFVLGGRGMEVVHDDEMLKQYVNAAVDVTPERPILIDRFLANAVEAEADALADGVDAFVPAVMEHIELAGIHSGDSACAIPPVTLQEQHIKTIEEYTLRISRELKVCGVMNIQYAICEDKVYVLEANPRASRTVPLVSKVCNVAMARIATQLMLGAKLRDLNLQHKTIPHIGVKEVVLPFNMFPEVDPVLGPEMRSTGEVLGMAPTFGLAYFKSQEAAQSPLPLKGTVFISVTDGDKPFILETARKFQELGFRIKATGGTCQFLRQNDVKAELSYKVHEPHRPNIVDEIKSNEIQLIINTPIGRMSAHDDAYIRKAAIKYKIPYVTTSAAAHACVVGILEHRSGRAGVKSLQSYHRDIR